MGQVKRAAGKKIWRDGPGLLTACALPATRRSIFVPKMANPRVKPAGDEQWAHSDVNDGDMN